MQIIAAASSRRPSELGGIDILIKNAAHQATFIDLTWENNGQFLGFSANCKVSSRRWEGVIIECDLNLGGMNALKEKPRWGGA
jgi:hypothetical protein